MPRKSSAIKPILCDPKTEDGYPLFRSNRKPSESFCRPKFKSTRTCLWFLGFFACILLNINALAQQQPAAEYALKAAFIFNFAKFVDWPAQAFAETNSPIVVG